MRIGESSDFFPPSMVDLRIKDKQAKKAGTVGQDRKETDRTSNKEKYKTNA